MESDGLIRITTFLSALAIIALWEIFAPRRPLVSSKSSRWFANLSLIFISNIVVRLVFPILPIGVAIVVQEEGWGILNTFNFTPWVATLIAILFLDLIIYLQHVLFHFLPVLWRLHRMHHSDLDLDATSGNRFHPLEIFISIVIKSGAILLIGASPLAVLTFEVILNASSIFNHGNILIPITVDKWLRLLVVTPDMHRVHHSIHPRETNSNFGFCFPWWDHMTGTYRPQPAEGHLEMTIGLKEFRDPSRLTLPHLLAQPFLRDSK